MLDQILRIPLLPVLAYQAVRVRKSALQLPEPDGPRRGQTGVGAPLRLLILGDSAGAGVGVDSQGEALSGQLSKLLKPDFDVTWQLEAKTGHTTAQSLKHLKGLEGPFDVVVTSLGVNDVTRGVSKRKFIQHQNQMVETLATDLQAKLIILSAVPDMSLFPALPQPLRWVLGQQSQRLNRGLAQVARGRAQIRHLCAKFDPDPTYVAPDGYHPSAKAYALWAELLAQDIRAHFSARI